MTDSSFSSPNLSIKPCTFLPIQELGDKDDTFFDVSDLELSEASLSDKYSPTFTILTTSPTMLELNSSIDNQNLFLKMHRYLSNKKNGNINGRLDDFANLLLIYNNDCYGSKNYIKNKPSFSGGAYIPFFRKNEYDLKRNALLSFSDHLKKQYVDYKNFLISERDSLHAPSNSIELANTLTEKMGGDSQVEYRFYS